MTYFDPNAAAPGDSGIFGLPYSKSDASLIYLPVPWEVTTSYKGGTSKGPEAILRGSKQVDLFDIDVLDPYKVGLYILPESTEVRKWNQEGKKLVQEVIHSQNILKDKLELEAALMRVNDLGHQLNQYVYQQVIDLLGQRKYVAVVGGDHSVPFGAIQAIAEQYSSFGILHFDAHSDTRRAYEGFKWSHASIIFNILEEIPQVEKVIQVGIRDFCEEEMLYTTSLGNRVGIFFDRDLARKKFMGIPWDRICKEIIEPLPENIWISFDIDGLDPRFCPNTGTPVPGGLDFHEANHLVSVLVESGRKIIGFDLNEVAPDLNSPGNEWDGNVGARLLYKLTAWLLASQNLAKRTKARI